MFDQPATTRPFKNNQDTSANSQDTNSCHISRKTFQTSSQEFPLETGGSLHSQAFVFRSHGQIETTKTEIQSPFDHHHHHAILSPCCPEAARRVSPFRRPCPGRTCLCRRRQRPAGICWDARQRWMWGSRKECRRPFRLIGWMKNGSS